MPSLGSILSIATSALRSHQRAINVVSHNIANAETEGYSRQLPVLSPWRPQTLPSGVFGTGVRVTNVAQVRDSLLDRSYLREVGKAGQGRALHGVLTQAEELLGNPAQAGILDAASNFFSSFSELATRPDNESARSLLRESGRQLATRFREASSGLSDLRAVTERRFAVGVERINELAAGIAELNGRIAADESAGVTSGDLRDTRRRMIDELGSLLPITVTERSGGAVGVNTGGLSLVDGGEFTEVEVRTVGGVLGIGVVGRPGLLPEVGGSLGGFIDALNTEIPFFQSRLDDLAVALMAEVNALHQSGTAPSGATGLDFFAGTSAWTMTLSGDVEADLTNIVAGTDLSGVYAAGANDIALSVAQLRDAGDLSGLGLGFHDFHQETVTELGLRVSSAGENATVHETLADNVDNQRLSVSGVSTDEELVRLIQYQTGYQAAARVVTAAQELLDTLVRM
ncbi:MAG: flagellar hook-associated protein FlgK [Gemmatimonadetes bacterium]|nr:flagellar hook-associated protein FlgK [Gemmatimonadota bacterium]